MITNIIELASNPSLVWYIPLYTDPNSPSPIGGSFSIRFSFGMKSVGKNSKVIIYFINLWIVRQFDFLKKKPY